MEFPVGFDLAAIRALYASGNVTPAALVAEANARIESGDPAAFISRATPSMIEDAVSRLLERAPEPNSLPLWGVPFAVKDNIDVAGLPLTCACPEYTRMPERDAAVVARLIAAGAICLGKTNLDQFATGLNGTRSPYGAPRSVFDADYISGGSSSGSAVSVAAGAVSFALGTDTAGSGRVPAMLNNIVGIKPTPGLLSTSGLVPACESLDCITVFALNVADGLLVRSIAEGYDPADPWSRPAAPHRLPREGMRIGVLAPDDCEFFGDEHNAALYRSAIANSGCRPVQIAYEPFREVAALLYEGAWVAERQAAFAATMLPQAALDPTVRAIFAGSANFDAVAAFEGLHKLQALRRQCEQELEKVDALLLPTAPRTFTVEQMLADPIALNAQLGTYTNFCNLLGLCAIAVPTGFSPDGLPFGVTLVGQAFTDDALGPLAQHLHMAARCGSGLAREAVPPALPEAADPPDTIEIAVAGAHLSGMPLNRDLLALGAQLVARTHTAPEYRLFLIPGAVPAKPGLVRARDGGGVAIEVEVWSMRAADFGRFVAAIPAPLGIGKVALAGGRAVSGFLCEEWATANAEEITRFGGWRAYMAHAQASNPQPSGVS